MSRTASSNKQSLKTLKISKNQLFFSGSAVGFQSSAGRHFQNKYKYLFCSVPTAVIFTTLLGIFTVNFLHPFSFTENTNATTERTANGDYYIETTTTDLNLTISTTPAGAQETASHDVTVKTDDPAGYTLTVSVNNDTSNALNLNGNTSATEKFNATSGTYDTPKALDENSWGFADTLIKKNNDQWAAVPLLSGAQQIKQTSSANTSGDKTTMHYAINAKYDGQHSNGNYSNIIVYSVTGNTIPYSGITDNMNMQDITRQMCTDTPLYSVSGTTYTLRDSRDNNTYKVRKLADGNCWMVQNLRLTRDTLSAAGNTTGSLTSSNTNVSSDKTLPAVNSSFYTNNNATCYNTMNHMDSGNTEYGAYYSWAAATLDNTVGSKSSGNVETSICPKSGSGSSSADSWHLPSGNTSGEWSNMMTKYTDGVSDFTGGSANTRRDFTDETITGTKNTYGNYTPNFPFSGYRNGSSTDNLQGSFGGFWSSTAYDADYAYNAYVYSAGYVSAGTGDGSKRGGYSVRCVLGSE